MWQEVLDNVTCSVIKRLIIWQHNTSDCLARWQEKIGRGVGASYVKHKLNSIIKNQMMKLGKLEELYMFLALQQNFIDLYV